MRNVTIKIEGMKSLDCAVRVQRSLASVPTVKGLCVALGWATVELEAESDEALVQAIRAAGNFQPVLPVKTIPQIWEVGKRVYLFGTPQIDLMAAKAAKNVA